MNVAFYAPLKAPTHPVPSGDRTMARSLLAALNQAGMDVHLVSELRTYSSTPSSMALSAAKSKADREITRLHNVFIEKNTWQPDIWLTYHPYYKSPDWLGPALSEILAIPYITVEASHAAHRAEGEWAAWHHENLRALKAADIHFTMTERDHAGLFAIPNQKARLVELLPFIELPAVCPTSQAAPSTQSDIDTVRLITVAMMRPGAKIDSYRMLVDALTQIADINGAETSLSSPKWTLDIVGDGEARKIVEAYVEKASTQTSLTQPPSTQPSSTIIGASLAASQITWHGELTPNQIRALMARCDIFVWPGFDEGYGLVYLEAAAAGLPTVAQNSGGVPAVVIDGCTGLLTKEGDIAAYIHALRTLIKDKALRRRLGAGARKFVHEERSLKHAAEIFSKNLRDKNLRVKTLSSQLAGRPSSIDP